MSAGIVSVAFDVVSRSRQPRRRVVIRRDDTDFVVVFQPENLVAFRNVDASALRKACEFLRWEVVSETPHEAQNPDPRAFHPRHTFDDR
jgi:hypothetical protein